MTSFALITEGITDQAVIENILFRYYKDEVDVRPLQPPRDATDDARAGGHGDGKRSSNTVRIPREFWKQQL